MPEQTGVRLSVSLDNGRGSNCDGRDSDRGLFWRRVWCLKKLTGGSVRGNAYLENFTGALSGRRGPNKGDDRGDFGRRFACMPPCFNDRLNRTIVFRCGLAHPTDNPSGTRVFQPGNQIPWLPPLHECPANKHFYFSPYPGILLSAIQYNYFDGYHV